jgi:hypothetical protein
MSEKRAHSRLVESGILGGFLEKAGFWRLDLAFAASRYLLIYENIGDS